MFILTEVYILLSVYRDCILFLLQYTLVSALSGHALSMQNALSGHFFQTDSAR